MRDAAIRYRTERPDLTDLPEELYSWDNSVYGKVKEEIPKDVPIPLGNVGRYYYLCGCELIA